MSFSAIAGYWSVFRLGLYGLDSGEAQQQSKLKNIATKIQRMDHEFVFLDFDIYTFDTTARGVAAF